MSEISEKCPIKFTAETRDATASITECADTMSPELEAECRQNTERYEALISSVAMRIWHETPLPKPGMHCSMYRMVDAEAKAQYEKLAENLISLIQYESCEHEFEGFKTVSTPDGPGEWHSVCKHCGGEKRGDE